MKQKVLLTGAAGGMGFKTFLELIKRRDIQEIVAFAYDNKANRKKMYPYEKKQGITVVYGDLVHYESVFKVLKGIDLVLHTAALVSPYIDDRPDLAMTVNIGIMHNLLTGLSAHKQEDKTKFVYIGTVAQTGDRMPPLHWGRVGDPIKTSIYDYYAVSKVAAERALVESNLKYWVSLRQTGIMGPNMVNAMDPIIFHNCLNNVLEYVSDRDSGRLLGNLSYKQYEGTLDQSFWCHIYNIGGGESCRVSTMDMYKVIYGKLGFKALNHVIDPKMFATKNFHGHYYLDSDILDEHLNFRQDSIEYFYDLYIKKLGISRHLSFIICQLPGGQKFMGRIIKMTLIKMAKKNRGTVKFIENDITEAINAYWGSKKQWQALPNDLSDFEMFKAWHQVINIDHGYDESKHESELTLKDLKKAATFRGGQCLSTAMNVGNWKSKLDFSCAFGHTFRASPRLVLEGGHWCPVCENESWNYAERAKVDPFFAQVWHPIHHKDEPQLQVKKDTKQV